MFYTDEKILLIKLLNLVACLIEVQDEVNHLVV